MAVPSLIVRGVVPVLALVIGLGVGTVVGAPKSDAGSTTSCQEAMKFADMEMNAGTQFAEQIANFLAASAANDGAGMDRALEAIGPINQQADAAMVGYVEASARCR